MRVCGEASKKKVKLKFRNNCQIHFLAFDKNPEMMLVALYVNLLANKRFNHCDNCSSLKNN